MSCFRVLNRFSKNRRRLSQKKQEKHKRFIFHAYQSAVPMCLCIFETNLNSLTYGERYAFVCKIEKNKPILLL